MVIDKKIKHKISLAPLTTFKIGGSAKFFVDAKSIEKFISAVKWAIAKEQKIFILAGGSNVLINDRGLNGLVIKIGFKEISLKGEVLHCQAGSFLSSAVKLAYINSLSGLEWAIGIPGTIGGAVRGNVGAFGGSISQSVIYVKAYNLKSGKFMIFNKNQCRFNYRTSIFKQKRDLVIIEVYLLLTKKNKRQIIKQTNAFRDYRIINQPKELSAGCIFKNLHIEEIEKVNPDLANLLRNNGLVKAKKVGAGWIIDKANLKGKACGKAKVSEKHANFIINTGKAKAQDVKRLIKLIKNKVKNSYNISLKEEIQYLN